LTTKKQKKKKDKISSKTRREEEIKMTDGFFYEIAACDKCE